ncbi:pentapeptide repeat-containing protein [Halorubrum sp. Hd13]|uniref:pentapeptide repeat-containing protein n=1 Tax=Halorubrum sp. Hd13 TaxID=1480728 RepID=UPI000B987A64|nr:pentapeptide repeat-containing protein [Halorubrum sp. Hd13]OYR45262.1 hypothetical protein DJ81_05305 [Halorubrum sp. Hd13]
MPDSMYKIPNDPDVTSEDIEPNADLSGADLTGASLRSANLTSASLRDADLTGAFLLYANLTDADLTGANLTDTFLGRADLTNADLFSADLTDANLGAADLIKANLRAADLTQSNVKGADFTNAFLGGVELSGITLSRSTLIDAPGERISTDFTDDDSISPEQRYDIIARTNHELRTAYSANGLIGRARSARVRERRARRREALAEGGLGGTAAWFGSLLSKVFTGYGVQLTWVASLMVALYLLSVGVYHFVGEMSLGRSLYYSVVTFTTSPPDPPASGLTSVVAGIETFAGTAAIVFLGYVLGTRERV